MLFAQDVPEFDKLVIYARAIGHAARNRFREAKEEIVQLSVKEDCVDLGSDIQIPIPQELLDFLTNTNLIEETSINSNPEATLERIDVQINLIDAAISALENRVKEVPSYLAYRGRNFDKFVRLQELKSEKRKLLKQRKEMT